MFRAKNRAVDPDPAIQAYVSGGRIPWSPGYKPYRSQRLQHAVLDSSLISGIRAGRPLPAEFGFGIDERIVEYPWVLSRLDTTPGRLLDAGSTLNQHYLLDTPQLKRKSVVITTLAPEWTLKRPGLGYSYADLRRAQFRDGMFPWIVCISTLEHVGMDNTRVYTTDDRFREAGGRDHLRVLAEFRRMLAPGGRLLLTVPFGRKADIGWMQQFDMAGIEEIRAAFGPATSEAQYFRYGEGGWTLSTAEACADCEYFDVRSAAAPAADRAAAARSVACLDLGR